MSLINQMLQDLEKRTSDEVSAAVPKYAQFGTVAPEANRKIWHKLVFVAMIFVLALFGYYLFVNRSSKIAAVATVKSVANQIDGSPEAKHGLATNLSSMRSSEEKNNSAIPSMKSLPLMLKLATNFDQIPQKPGSGLGKKMHLETASPLSASATADSQSHLDASGKQLVASVVETKLPPKQPSIAEKIEENRGVVKIDKSAVVPLSSLSPTMVKEISPQQKAEGEYRQASVYQQQGRTSEAILAFEQVLKLDATHAPARQALISLFLENNRQDEAMRELRSGLLIDANQVNFAMILARLQVERAKVNEAIDTLQRSLGAAQDRADYLSFLAALKQKLGLHKEAIALYRQALQKHGQNGVWWMGLGISLQAEGQNQGAIDAFKQSKTQSGLSAELHAYVDQKINQLQK